jgi:SnoaL-like protein
MSAESMKVVRKSLRLRERSDRTIDERLALRFPRLAAAYARLIGRLPPSSRFRQAAVWRSSQLATEAFNRRDLDAAMVVSGPGFEYHPPREFVEVGFFDPCYRGPAGLREYMSAWSDVWGADLRVEAVEVIAFGDHVVLLADLSATGEASRIPFTGKIATVSRLKNGKLIRTKAYLDHAQALEAVGLRV